MSSSTQSWQRLSVLSVLFFVVKFIRIYWYGFVPILLSDSTFKIDKWIAFLIVLVLIIIFSFLNYYFFKYQIEDDKISIHSGVFVKRLREMKRDRIQNMNLEQNIVYRIFSLKRVKFESAGSDKTEFILPAISQSAFEQVQLFITNKVDSIQTDSTNTQTAKNDDEYIYKLNLKELIKHGLSSSRIGIVIGGIFTFYDSIKQNLSDLFGSLVDLESTIENDLLVNNSASVIILYIIVILFLVFFFSILVELVIYYEFRLSVSNHQFTKSHGLFNKKIEQINAKKVQQLVINQNPVLGFFKRYNGHFKIADSSENKETKKSYSLICLTSQVINDIKQILFPDFDSLAKKEFSVQKQMIFHRIKLFLLYPGIIIFISYIFFDENLILGLYLLLVLLIIQSILVYKTWQITVTDNHIVVKKGRFLKSEHQAEFYKFQWITIKQNFYQRRKKLASIVIGHASGTLSIPYLKLVDAVELSDWILFKIESSTDEWF